MFNLSFLTGHKTKLLTAYVAGVGSGLTAVGAFYLARKSTFPNPKHALMSVLPTLRANPEVRSLVGSNLRPGLFKTYSYIGGRPRKWHGRGMERDHVLIFRSTASYVSSVWGTLQCYGNTADAPTKQRITSAMQHTDCGLCQWRKATSKGNSRQCGVSRIQISVLMPPCVFVCVTFETVV